MTTIVCGVDNSPTAAAAARKAARLAVALGGDLHLVSAYGKIESETVEVGSETLLVSNEMEADRVAGAIAVELRREFPGLEVVPSSSDGRPGDALVHAAERLGADLIVVGNKRVQGIARVLGSIARDVVAHAPCDVYVAHTHTHTRQRIGAPEMARAITSRWISEVPSKIVQIFEAAR